MLRDFFFLVYLSGFCRAMLCKRGLCRLSVRLSAGPFDTFVNSVKTNKLIFIFLLPVAKPFWFSAKCHGNYYYYNDIVHVVQHNNGPKQSISS